MIYIVYLTGWLTPNELFLFFELGWSKKKPKKTGMCCFLVFGAHLTPGNITVSSTCQYKSAPGNVWKGSTAICTAKLSRVIMNTNMTVYGVYVRGYILLHKP